MARSPAFHFQHGTKFYHEGKLAEAITAYRECLRLDPAFPNARYNLGVALGDAEEYEEAMTCLEAVVETEPERPETYNSLGYLTNRQRRPLDAIVHYERAIELRPDYAEAHFNLGMTLLQLGDYRRGFSEYEWRWETGQFTPFACPHPKWDGGPILNKALLIHTEQGAGDAIQFARYLTLAAERWPEIDPRLSSGSDAAVFDDPGHRRAARGRHHPGLGVRHYCPLLSLPLVFGTTLETIPDSIPYLDIATLQRRKTPSILPAGTRPKIGIVWAGSPTYRNDRHRSIALSELLPILRLPDFDFYSLQKGERCRDLLGLPPNCRVQDLDPSLADFGDTALVIDALDLVITVDTAVAHLAGALAKPLWTLLPEVPDWRWA
jgi:hypothetical protein